MRRFLFLIVPLLFYATCTDPASPGPPFSAPVRIMPLGNSITEGDWENRSYRPWLWRMLADSGYAVDFVGGMNGVIDEWPDSTLDSTIDWDHEGHYGWPIEDIRDSMGTWARANPPDIVLMHVGSNNLYEDPAPLLEGVGQTIDSIRSVNHSVTVLLAQIIPYDTTGDEMGARELTAWFREFNAAVARGGAVFSTAVSPVVVVDHYTGFDGAAELADGIHPNEAGEKKMARRWFHVLDSIFAARGFVQP